MEQNGTWPQPPSLVHWMRWGAKLSAWQHALDWPEARWKRLIQGMARDALGATDTRECVLEDLLEEVLEGDAARLADELSQLVDTTPLSSMAATLAQRRETLAPRFEADDMGET